MERGAWGRKYTTLSRISNDTAVVREMMRTGWVIWVLGRLRLGSGN